MKKMKFLQRLVLASIFLIFHFSFVISLQAQCGVKVKPADTKAYNDALTLYEGHRYSEASQVMRRVAGRNPKAADPQFWLGMMAVKDGFNATGIRRYFTRCIELCPQYPNALAHFYMGMIYYTDDRYDDAVAELERYFELANGVDNTDRAVSAAYEEASNYLYWSQFLAEATLNMAPFDPQPVAGVSSKHDEMLPFLTADGQEFYYLRRLPEPQAPTIYHRELERKQWQLCCSRLKDTAFTAGSVLPAPFNSGAPEGGVSITADGPELYYSIIHNVNGYSNSDIYCVRRVAGRWQKPEALGPQVNGDRSWESQPTVSADGRVLLFASNRQGGQGGIDIWRCHRLPNGDWSRAVNLGPNVNTRGNEKAPFLAADGRTLYFLSDGWQGFGGYDIYFANLDDPYGNRPTNLGLPINTEGDEVSFGVTADGRRAYFGGRVEGSRSSEILMFDLYPAARPEPMKLCHIALAGPRGERDTAIMLSEQYATVVAFGDSLSLPTIVCGKARDFKGRVALDDTVAPLNIKFLPGSRLSPEDEMVVDALAAWLVAHPRVRIDIECPVSTEARAVHERLRAKGIRPGRVAYRGGTDIKRPQIRLATDQQTPNF